MKVTLNPFSYTNRAKHKKMDTTSMLKIHFYVLCAKHVCVCVYIYMKELLKSGTFITCGSACIHTLSSPFLKQELSLS
jgi:hypothetical protein